MEDIQRETIPDDSPLMAGSGGDRKAPSSQKSLPQGRRRRGIRLKAPGEGVSPLLEEPQGSARVEIDRSRTDQPQVDQSIADKVKKAARLAEEIRAPMPTAANVPGPVAGDVQAAMAPAAPQQAVATKSEARETTGKAPAKPAASKPAPKNKTKTTARKKAASSGKSTGAATGKATGKRSPARKSPAARKATTRKTTARRKTGSRKAESPARPAASTARSAAQSAENIEVTSPSAVAPPPPPPVPKSAYPVRAIVICIAVLVAVLMLRGLWTGEEAVVSTSGTKYRAGDVPAVNRTPVRAPTVTRARQPAAGVPLYPSATPGDLRHYGGYAPYGTTGGGTLPDNRILYSSPWDESVIHGAPVPTDPWGNQSRSPSYRDHQPPRRPW